MPNVLITGANRGLGLALAEHFASRHDTCVIATTRDASTASDLHAAARRCDDRIEVIAVDVASATSIAALAEALASRDIMLDVLVNNAGTASWTSFGEIDEVTSTEIMRVNALGPVLVTQALAGRVRDGGKIVNISSTLGSIERATSSWGLVYSMSKAALNMFSKILSNELRDRQIAVLALHPGWVRTRMGGDEAPLEIAQSVAGMMTVIDGLTLATSGQFLTYEGAPLPW